MIVDVVGNPTRCAVVITSTHWSRVIRPAEMRSRTSWSRISADVPGRLSTPAARSARRYSSIEQRDRTAPYSTSSGEKPWMCMSGSCRLIAFVSSR